MQEILMHIAQEVSDLIQLEVSRSDQLWSACKIVGD